MAVTYKKLFHLLIERGIATSELTERAGFSANILTRLRRDQYVSLESIEKICATLGCKVDDILEFNQQYIDLLIAKDHALISILEELRELNDYSQKKAKIKALLSEDAEARIFEIISYAILKNHYKNITVFFGYTRDTIDEVALELYKTGRTNANDGGIDFVMRPVGRFFQVTEVNNYDKYLLDIDKVMHFPISFVIKTRLSKERVLTDMEQYIAHRSSGMAVLEERYHKAIEEIITINELQAWTEELNDSDVDGIIRDIDIYYKLEMNLEAEDEE